MDLTNSKRILRSSSYVMIELTPDEQKRIEKSGGRALDKINFIKQVKMLPKDVAKAREGLDEEQFRELRDSLSNLDHILSVLTGEHREAVTNLELAPYAAGIPVSLLTHIAGIVADREGAKIAGLQVEAFKKRLKTAPIGYIHLERIEMYPAGVERGELMFTVPLAPLETVTISHKEWSTSSEEYERIVQDYFESYSERGVAEKTDVSMSTENESKHSSTFNFSANVSGSFGPVSMSVSTGLTFNSEDRQAVKQSAQRSREVTEKASARTRQEHKITAKLEASRGTEDNSFRTISNPHSDRALRIDYYRMMRKWRTDLFRYGLRLTFDIAIPSPGARLWALHRRVRELDEEIRKPFEFPLKPGDLTDGNWQQEAAKYGAVIDPPPKKSVQLSISRTLAQKPRGFEIFDFAAPDGYFMKTEVMAKGMIEPGIAAIMYPPNTQAQIDASTNTFEAKSTAFGGDKHASWYLYYTSPTGEIIIMVAMEAVREEALLSAWQSKSWTTLRDTAFAAWQAQNAKLQAERDRLWMELAGKDTLTLRRLEREELIRQTLYWIIGVQFDPTPSEVGKILEKLVRMEQEQLPDDWPGADMFRQLSNDEWETAAGFGDFVKYIHHAVEWENLLYFLYPYFWGSDDVAREKMLFEHPDPNHRDFLRAGYARIVVPIRPGFEETFTQLLDTGVFTGADTSPYVSVAEEIAAFARTNYAGVPPANPEKHARPLLLPEQRKTWETMQSVIKLIESYHETNNAYPSDLSQLPGAPFQDAWGNDLVYKNPGSGNDYDLLSLGADGQAGGEGADADISAAAGASLVASWFDFTPTSGIDIEIDAKLENVN